MFGRAYFLTMNTVIYLDYNATCPIRPEVIDHVTDVMREGGNPSSVHSSGRRARNRVEDARRQLAELVGCKPPEIIFTSGGTEANNMALNGFSNRRLFVSAGEHDSVRALAADKQAREIQLTADGLVDLEDLRGQLTNCEEPALVSIMLANNETGVCQDMAAIASIVHEFDALLHTDAIQILGKIPVNFKELGVDCMSVSGHKIGGPQGQGALIVKEGVVLTPLQKGGGQELGRRGGTENVAGIAGFGLAAELAMRGLDGYVSLASLRDHIEQSLQKICPQAVAFGQNANRLPNTTCIAMPGVPSELQVMNFDLAQIAVSAGSACSSGKVKASHVLMAMGSPEDRAGQSIRVSLGRETTQSHVDKFIEVWEKLYVKQKAKAER
jgi:cysteine desulfurase